MLLILVWTTVFLFTLIFACGTHVDAQWGPPAQNEKYCGNPTAPQEAFVISSTLTDLITLILPFPMVSRHPIMMDVVF